MQRIVLSASRRTDIPAFYMPWFMSRIRKGFFEVVNPYNKISSRIPAGNDHIHTIVFWSKDFGPFLSNGYDDELIEKGYNLFFNFTINSTDPILEPGVPSLAIRLDQLARLAEKHGPECIQWRFDPICHYISPSGQNKDNTGQFLHIAAMASAVDIPVCITSYVDLYKKVLRRQTAAGIKMIDPPLDEKANTIIAMAEQLSDLGIQLQLCCEKELLAAIPSKYGVASAACIPNDLLIKYFGPGISIRRDTGQRGAAGCGCGISRDIGSYNEQPCNHRCLFCYANPASDHRVQSHQKIGH